LWLQSPKPVLQAKEQSPTSHVGAAPGTEGHTTVQAPQLVGSVSRSTQVLLQQVSPAMQGVKQAPQ